MNNKIQNAIYDVAYKNHYCNDDDKIYKLIACCMQCSSMS